MKFMPDMAAESVSQLRVLSRNPLCATTSLSNLDDTLTPNDQFFIRNHFPVPQLDASEWRLDISGHVERSEKLSYSGLTQLPSKEIVCLLECAGNSRSTMQPPAEGVPWDHGAVSSARWTGVPVATVLEHVSIRPGARHVLFQGTDFGKERSAPGVLAPGELHYAMSVPLEKALHPDTILAYRMNGEVLGPSHGYPVRLVVPGWYGMASVKWLAKIQVIDQDFEGFHQNDYYVYVAEGGADQAMGGRVMATRVKSLISWPSRGDLVGTGSHIVRGVAWSGEGSVTRVEVSADDNRTWHEASVQDAQSPYAWHNWEYIWEATYPGYYLIRARATDSQGNVQPLYALWNFRGYAVNSVHVVPVTVRASS